MIFELTIKEEDTGKSNRINFLNIIETLSECSIKKDYVFEQINEKEVTIISERYDVIANVASKFKSIYVDVDDTKKRAYCVQARIKENRLALFLVAHIISLCLIVVAHHTIQINAPFVEPIQDFIKTIFCITISFLPWLAVIINLKNKRRCGGLVVTKIINDEYRLIKTGKNKERWKLVGPSGHIKLDFSLWENKVLVHKNTIFGFITDPYVIIQRLLARGVVDLFEMKSINQKN
jgi:hypothetical protein